MELLKEHLLIAIFLGALSAGVIEGIKGKDWFKLEGNKLAIFATIVEALVAIGAGMFYLNLAGQNLAAVVLLTLLNAEAIYAVYRPFKDRNTEEY